MTRESDAIRAERECNATAVEALADQWDKRAEARARGGLSTTMWREAEAELRMLARRIREGL